MRFLLRGGELGLEQRGDEEAVRGRFDGPDFSLRATGDYREAGFHGGPFVLGIHFEVTEEFFAYEFLILAIKGLQVGTGTQADLRDFAGEFGRAAFAAGHGAGYGIDHDV